MEKMYPDTSQTNCQGLQFQDVKLKLEKQEEPNLSASHEETCSSNQFSLSSIKEDNFLWNMEESEKLCTFQKPNNFAVPFPDYRSHSFNESMIKTESICGPPDDDDDGVVSSELVKSEQNVDSTVWESKIENGTVIKKENNSFARDSKSSFKLSGDLMNCPINSIATDVCEVKNMSLLRSDPARDKLFCVEEKRDEVAEKSRNFDANYSAFIRPYKCLDCGARFSSKVSIEVHIIKHVGQKLHKCQSIRVEGVERHLSQTFYSCDVCAKVYSSPRNLRRHKQIHTGEKPYKCDFCGKAFCDNSRLNLHRRKHTGEKPYKCDDCNAEFSDKSNLYTHKKKHAVEKPYKCDFCGQAFYHRSQLMYHTRLHTGEKPYKCEDCNAEFSHKRYLHVHQKTHAAEKPYKCDYCNAEFSLKGNLHIHKRKHTGEKPYKCDYCNAKFSRQGSLHIHKRKHTGEKPYKCDECNAKFSQQCSLHRHKRTHTGEKPYKCDFCGQAFHQSGHLNSHKRIHTGDKPYRCDCCNAEFSQQGSLHRHRRIHM